MWGCFIWINSDLHISENALIAQASIKRLFESKNIIVVIDGSNVWKAMVSLFINMPTFI